MAERSDCWIVAEFTFTYLKRHHFNVERALPPKRVILGGKAALEEGDAERRGHSSSKTFKA